MTFTINPFDPFWFVSGSCVSILILIGMAVVGVFWRIKHGDRSPGAR